MSQKESLIWTAGETKGAKMSRNERRLHRKYLSISIIKIKFLNHSFATILKGTRGGNEWNILFCFSLGFVRRLWGR